MRVLVVHLSDLHIRSSEDPVLQRGPAIVAAVRNLDDSLDAALLVVSGDVAFSGASDELAEGYVLLDGIAEELRGALIGPSPVPVYTVAVPGNHDCDFSRSGRLRDLVVTSALTDPEISLDAAQLEVCLAPQQPFYEEFLPGFAPLQQTASGPYDPRLYYEYIFEVPGGGAIEVRCANTAWLSQLNEGQGDLAFPAEAFQSNTQGAAVALTVFHHPYNWLESTQAKALRRAVESVSDVILTGHEHDGDYRMVRGRSGERSQYLEADALQTDDPAQSAFHALVLDTDARQQRMVTVRWDGTRYAPDDDRDWEAFQVNRLRRRDAFQLSSEHEAFLDDPGVELRHPVAGGLALSDVFVTPDLRRINASAVNLDTRIRGHKAFDELRAGARVLVTGDTQSGKTSFAKWLFRRYHDEGLVPVYIDPRGETLRPGRGLQRRVRSAFVNQYGPDLTDGYDQLAPEQRVVLVDDFHRATCDPTRHSVLDALSKHAAHVFLFAHDLTTDLAEMVGPSALSQFDQYRLLPFGHVQRNDLVERWIGLDRAETLETAAQRLDRLSVMLNGVFGKGYVPAYPVFALSVLQASDSSATVNLKASTHGYFYELFIRAALARGGDPIAFDVAVGYLSFVAYQLFDSGHARFDVTEHQSIHDGYEKAYDIRRSAEAMRNDFVARDLFVERDGAFEFKHDYCYYYFVASYIADHLESEDAGLMSDVRGHVRRLSRSLADADSANILLFLAHLTRHPYVINQMLSAAKEHFPGHQPVTLDGDLDFLTPGAVPAEVVYHETDTRDFRRQMLSKIDDGSLVQSDPEAPVDAGAVTSTVDELSEVMAAISTLKILGQILKNFPGTLGSVSKQSIAQECHDLGFRTVGWATAPFREHREDAIRQLAASLSEGTPKANPDDFLEAAERSLLDLLNLLVFGAVRTIADAVGSRDLDVTYDRVLDEQPSSAARLVRTSLAIDQSDGFPARHVERAHEAIESNPVALTVLRYLVVQHFHLIPRSVQVRQRTCDLLGVPFTRSQIADPRRRLIPTTAGRRGKG